MKVHVALCFALVGCVADPPSLDLSESSIKIAPGDGCTSWECGSNSPVIAAVDFWDLSESLNVLNSRGYKVTFFGKRTENTFVSFVPHVTNGVLTATRGGIILDTPAELEKLVWRVVNTNDNKTYELVVEGVTSTPWWAPPGTQFGSPIPPAAAYYLGWREYLPDWLAHPDPVIKKYGPPITPVCGENPEDTGMADFTAVLFDRDWIDADGITVLGEKSNWFNIGCAGHALAKQHLTGMTIASANRLYLPQATVNQKTANLKMITADYCGTGHAFTFAGQPLRWKTDRYTSVKSTLPYGQVQVLEARWNQHGAICLNTPRVDFRNYTNDPGAQYFPNGVEPLLVTHSQAELDADPELVNWCTPENPRPPPCVGSHNDIVRGALATSVNHGAYINPVVIPL